MGDKTVKSVRYKLQLMPSVSSLALVDSVNSVMNSVNSINCSHRSLGFVLDVLWHGFFEYTQTIFCPGVT